MSEPEMIEMEGMNGGNTNTFLLYRPVNISKKDRTLHLRLLAAGLLGMMIAGILFVLVNIILLHAQPPVQQKDIFIDLDFDNPVELEDLDDIDDLMTPQLMDKPLSETPSSLQDPSPPLLVYYRPAKTPFRLHTLPANDTHLYSSLADPLPLPAPPATPTSPLTCSDQSCPSVLPPYHTPHVTLFTPHVTLFTKINNRFVGIIATTVYMSSHSPTTNTHTTTPTTATTGPTTATPPPTTTTTATSASDTSMTISPTITATATSAIDLSVTVVAYTPSTVAPAVNTEPVYPDDDDSGYNRGTVVLYMVLVVLAVFLMVVLHELLDLNRKDPWSLWTAETIRTVTADAMRRRVRSRYGNLIALRTLREGTGNFYQVVDANPTSRNPHRQPCCPPNCGIMHPHHHHLDHENPDCHNPHCPFQPCWH